MCLQVYIYNIFQFKKVTWLTIMTCPWCCWRPPGCSSPRSSAWWGSSSRGPRGWDGSCSARPRACSAACLNTYENNLNIRYLHTIHTLTPATYQQSQTNDIQENVQFNLSTLSLCKLLIRFDVGQVFSNVLPLTSDAHVDVLVLVEVVVLELVHVVLWHAGVVMQLELERCCVTSVGGEGWLSTAYCALRRGVRCRLYLRCNNCNNSVTGVAENMKHSCHTDNCFLWIMFSPEFWLITVLTN